MINGREVFIQERLHTEFAHWLKWSALSGAVVFLALAALDAVVYPVLAARFLVYRVAAASCLTLIAVAAGKVGNHRPRLLLGLAAVWISAVTIEAMILQTGGHLSPYATGMILLIVCVLAYIQGNMLFHVLAAASIYSIYVLPIMVLETITDFRMFFVANFFILSIILVMLTLRFLALRNFREQAAALYEVRTFGDAPSFAGGEAYADPAAIVRRLREEIAARRSTEKLLEASEKKYRTLFESAPDAFYINDLAGTFLDGNRKAEELTGYRLEEAVGRNFLSLGMLPLSQVPRALKLLALNALGRATGPDEFELVAKGGGCRTPVEISTFPAIIDGKRIVLGIARNISDRKRAEEALRHSESRYRSIADASMDVIYRLDPEGRVTYASPAIMRVLGYKVDEIMGRRFLEIIHQDDHPAAHAASRELREGTAVRSLDLRILRKGGGFIHGEVSIVPVLRDGAVYEIQGVIHDISERKRAEDALKSAKYRLEFLVSSTPAIIYTCRYGGDWGATFMSENLRDVLGYEVRENLEAPGFWFDHIHPGDRDRILEGLQTLSEKGLHSHEYRFRHKDGTYRWMLDRVRVVRNKEGRP
ncbi:MAG: PAS domain S-box protein, partial [Nitrospirota bacterium]|nr:PAS domain S-box protein [Nitrospirota bacterium]